ncbi:MAG: DUF1622 domain-containing protein [Sphingomonadales bacterium]
MLDEFVRLAVTSLEVAGTIAILMGTVISTGICLRQTWREGFARSYPSYRANLGRSILLGLELLVAGDILKSLVIEPSISDLIVLAGLILIRTFLSISLGVEINGHWPWEETRLDRERGKIVDQSKGEPGS